MSSPQGVDPQGYMLMAFTLDNALAREAHRVLEKLF